MKEAILPCGCHKVDESGQVWTRQEQFSQKGLQGIQTRLTESWRKISGVLGKSGYLQVMLHGRIVRGNRLIASNFIPNPLSYPESHHKNGNRIDNRVDNLEWGHQNQNPDARKRHGRAVMGSVSPNAKLTEEKVKELKAL